MAFETFLTTDKQRPRKRRRLTYALSAAVHAALLAVGVAASYANVDEVAAPKGTLITLALPPPAPPPAAKGSEKPRTSKPKTKVHPTERVQPRLTALARPPQETPPPDTGGDEPLGRPDGKEGGVGVTPGTGEDSPIVRLPPHVARGQLAIDPQAPQHRAKLPPAITRPGTVMWALLRVCVDRDGNVVDVSVVKGYDPAVDPSFVNAVRTWRYIPYKVEGRPVPFCSMVRYEVRTTS